MSAGIATPRPERLIPTLTGFITAPDWMSDEEVRSLSAQLYGADSEPSFLVRKDQYREPLRTEGKYSHPSDMPLGNHHQVQSEVGKILYRFALQAAAFAHEGVRFLGWVFRPTKSGRISSYRISMVVVAITMVVGLRVLVNQHSKHTRTDGEGA
ncbi:hypothetical protein [Acetobacter oryzoeni]|uniref:Uncharacterized protein n=1 Tax=Acetobacter oryzoeni TaxID=2500548 RepID=A0A5B9GI75_9PROT|nr:hypothetical protein [Acetobacter oryzoeni]MCP1202283.1 hypothetical protein [Acetobacter oryzoeni]QEE86008.1 hypothetical protein EOV40_010015 [Acetobacter oryzoeni]